MSNGDLNERLREAFVYVSYQYTYGNLLDEVACLRDELAARGLKVVDAGEPSGLATSLGNEGASYPEGCSSDGSPVSTTLRESVAREFFACDLTADERIAKAGRILDLVREALTSYDAVMCAGLVWSDGFSPTTPDEWTDRVRAAITAAIDSAGENSRQASHELY